MVTILQDLCMPILFSFGVMMEFGAKGTQLVDYSLSISMASVVPNLASWVLDLILVMDNVDPVQSVLTFGGG